MHQQVAAKLMEEFAEATGVAGNAAPRRYLWTDAFAVCNYLGLYRQTGGERYLRFARDLVDQVHYVLGRHRDDDARRGWISGLSEVEGARHPTCRGLRIGKRLNERRPDEPYNSHLEWDRDGQYFHYLTKWMHALCQLERATGESSYGGWARELAIAAHHAFTQQISADLPKRLLWKMSIDLTRPLVNSMGQHDPLDALVTYLELTTKGDIDREIRTHLSRAIADADAMCDDSQWATDDPLGIGGLLEAAARLAQLHVKCGASRLGLLRDLLVRAEVSLRRYSRTALNVRSGDERLAFRELGLSIGLQGLPHVREALAPSSELAPIYDRLVTFGALSEQIRAFWINPAHRLSHTWTEHRDINTVMLATSLSPDGFLQI